MCECGRKEIRKIFVFMSRSRREIYWFWSESSPLRDIPCQRRWADGKIEKMRIFYLLPFLLWVCVWLRVLGDFKSMSQTNVKRRAGEIVFFFFNFILISFIPYDWLISDLFSGSPNSSRHLKLKFNWISIFDWSSRDDVFVFALSEASAERVGVIKCVELHAVKFIAYTRSI